MAELTRDFKYGWRMLRKRPVFALMVVVTLALAIGANTVVFTFTNLLLLRPLPLRDPTTLGWVFGNDPQRGNDRAQVSAPDYIDYRRSLRSFSALAARSEATLTMSGRGDAERLEASAVTANLFQVWGLRPKIGRLFRAGEDAAGAEPVVVLSHQFWQRRFAGDPSIIGTALTLDGKRVSVIGVLEPAIEIGTMGEIDVWVPLVPDPAEQGRDSRGLRVVGRLAPGVTAAQADAEVRALAAALERDHPVTNKGWGARVVTTREAITGRNTFQVLALLSLAVGLLLLIACANLANAMLARSMERNREIALRVALGAGRRMLVRQLLAEYAVLAAVGGALGLGVAYAGVTAIKATVYEPSFALLAIDARVVLYAIGVTLLTCVLFGLAPALRAAHADPIAALAQGSARMIGGVGVRRSRAILVVAQVTLAVALTVLGALVARSMFEQTRIDLGFRAGDLWTFRVDLPQSTYEDPERLRQFYDRAAERLSSLPRVRSVGVVDHLPVLGGVSITPLDVEGRAVARQADQPWAMRTSTSAGYFETAEIPLITGRALAPTDRQDALPVVVVNRELARRYFGSAAQALGKRVSLGRTDGPATWRVIVGVVGDIRPAEITAPPNPELYLPLAQESARNVSFMLRAPGGDATAASIRSLMREIDPALAVYELRTMEQGLAVDRSSEVMLAGLFVSFALIALVLAATGLYGVIAYLVSQRTREIGIRIALGAVPRVVGRMVLGEAAVLFGLGMVLGLGVALLLARGMRSVLYGIGPVDPPTYVAASAILAGVMFIAAYVPARRAMRVNPLSALRSE
jgi:putative ABC transport system permease protein